MLILNKFSIELLIPLQLMKAAVPAESYVIYLFIFLHHLESPVMSTGSSQVGAALSPSF